MKKHGIPSFKQRTALELRQDADAEISRRRSKLSNEEDRLQQRREELDIRTEKLEKRENSLNKRQGLIDRRSNEIDKLHSQELEELQRVSQMTTNEAREILLAEVEKEARADMVRVIRQIEAEAREEGEN